MPLRVFPLGIMGTHNKPIFSFFSHNTSPCGSYSVTRIASDVTFFSLAGFVLASCPYLPLSLGRAPSCWFPPLLESFPTRGCMLIRNGKSIITCKCASVKRQFPRRTANIVTKMYEHSCDNYYTSDCKWGSTGIDCECSSISFQNQLVNFPKLLRHSTLCQAYLPRLKTWSLSR